MNSGEHLRCARTISSALWAAYGDVLGFPTELVDISGVKRRIGQLTSDVPRPWKRMVGGRAGVWVDLPAGSYSDDTQLRLSTSRAIRADGYFDVEAFAKIELPVWLSYCLGAGRGSKIGASALSFRNANWFSNFFEQKDVVYINGGGNGAAMRIQPHVWAAHNLGNPASYLPEVIQNSLCTHGHPRGIAGAVTHAVLLAHILLNGEIPPPSDWAMFGSFITVATEYIEENPDLSTFWLPTWNSRAGKQFAEEMENVRLEWERDVALCELKLRSPETSSYSDLVGELEGFSNAQRGSGIKSSLFSLVAAWLYKDDAPDKALIEVANLLGSDTDTIGTMAGALIGAMNPSASFFGPLMDKAYIESEARRLFDVSQEKSTVSFTYPDLLHWVPPRNQLDTVATSGGELSVGGLGRVISLGEKFMQPRGDFEYQWLELEFGQNILCKKRVAVSEMPPTSIAPGYSESGLTVTSVKLGKGRNGLLPKLNNESLHVDHNKVKVKYVSEMAAQVPKNFDEHMSSKKAININALTDEVIRSGFDETMIGRHILEFALRDDIEKAIAYAAIIVKARSARIKKTGS